VCPISGFARPNHKQFVCELTLQQLTFLLTPHLQEKISATVDKLTHKNKTEPNTTGSTGHGTGGGLGTTTGTTGSGYDNTSNTGAGYGTTTDSGLGQTTGATGTGGGYGTTTGSGLGQTTGATGTGGYSTAGVTGGTTTGVTGGTGEVITSAAACAHSTCSTSALLACLASCMACLACMIAVACCTDHKPIHNLLLLVCTKGSRRTCCAADHRPGDLHEDGGPRGAHREEEVRARAQVRCGS